MRGFLRRLWIDERAATAIEYTLIVGLISVAGISIFFTLGSKVLNMLNNTLP